MIRERVDQRDRDRSKPAEVIATSWRHTTARAVDGRPPDPQLHSHVLFHGAVRDGRHGSSRSTRARGWSIRRELGAAYRTELARELTRLGFQVERGTGRGGRYFEIDGVPARLCDRWSSRHHQVQAAIDTAPAPATPGTPRATIAAGGATAPSTPRRDSSCSAAPPSSPTQERPIGAYTRDRKQLVTRGDLDRHWAEAGRALGLEPTPSSGSAPSSAIRSRRPRISELLERLTEFDATFADRDARAVALEASTGTAIQDATRRLAELRTTGELLPLTDGRETTRRHRNGEEQTVALAERLAATRGDPHPSRGSVKTQTAALQADLGKHGGVLGEEQRQAVKLACADRQLVLIEGQAGTGKSTALIAHRPRPPRRRQERSSSPAPPHWPPNGSQSSSATPASTPVRTRPQALNAAITSGRVTIGPGTTVIHDEAALASTREQHQLLAAVEASGARLIEVGDPQQSRAVGAGGLWPHLEHATQHNARAHRTHPQRARARPIRPPRPETLPRPTTRTRDPGLRQPRTGSTIHRDRRDAEDAALEAAHADRQAGKHDPRDRPNVKRAPRRAQRPRPSDPPRPRRARHRRPPDPGQALRAARRRRHPDPTNDPAPRARTNPQRNHRPRHRHRPQHETAHAPALTRSAT